MENAFCHKAADKRIRQRPSVLLQREARMSSCLNARRAAGGSEQGCRTVCVCRANANLLAGPFSGGYLDCQMISHFPKSQA